MYSLCERVTNIYVIYIVPSFLKTHVKFATKYYPFELFEHKRLEQKCKMDKVGIRIMVQFFFLEEKTVKEIFEILSFLRNCSILDEWIQMWQNKHRRYTTFQTTVIQENIDKVLDMVLNDCRLKLDKYWIQCVELRENYVEK